MSDDAETRYWQDQHDRHGPGALPSDFELHPDRQADQQAETEAYYAAATPPPQQFSGDAGYELDPGAEQYDYEPQEFYEPPQMPDPLTSENYAAEMQDYLDWRDSQQQLAGEVDLSQHQAWLAEQADVRAAQQEQETIDSERQFFSEGLPGQIEAALNHRPGSEGAAQMLAERLQSQVDSRARGKTTSMVRREVDGSSPS